jgi:hypothetical protein
MIFKTMEFAAKALSRQIFTLGLQGQSMNPLLLNMTKYFLVG